MTTNEKVKVTKYLNSSGIKELIENNSLIEAFIHIQLNLERILLSKILRTFDTQRAMVIRRTIDSSSEKTGTSELIKWSYFLGAIDQNEYSEIKDFMKKRNLIVHRHGKSFESKKLKEAVKKGIRFLENNNS